MRCCFKSNQMLSLCLTFQSGTSGSIVRQNRFAIIKNLTIQISVRPQNTNKNVQVQRLKESFCDLRNMETKRETRRFNLCASILVCGCCGKGVGVGAWGCLRGPSSCEKQVRPFIESSRGSRSLGSRLTGRRTNGSAPERDSPPFRFQWRRVGEAGCRKHTWLNGHWGRNQR